MESGDLPGRRSCALRSETCIRSRVRRNFHMKYAWLLILCFLGGFILPGQAQEKPTKGTGNAALEKELYEVELFFQRGVSRAFGGLLLSLTRQNEAAKKTQNQQPCVFHMKIPPDS